MPQAKKKRSAERADKPDVDERWWCIVVPIDPERGPGRYGVWEDKPVVKITDGETLAIVNARNGHNDEEPTVYINMAASLTLAVGQMAHFDAQPVGAQQPNAPDQS